jgi:hypothetical protein
VYRSSFFVKYFYSKEHLWIFCGAVQIRTLGMDSYRLRRGLRSAKHNNQCDMG